MEQVKGLFEGFPEQEQDGLIEAAFTMGGREYLVLASEEILPYFGKSIALFAIAVDELESVRGACEDDVRNLLTANHPAAELSKTGDAFYLGRLSSSYTARNRYISLTFHNNNQVTEAIMDSVEAGNNRMREVITQCVIASLGHDILGDSMLMLDRPTGVTRDEQLAMFTRLVKAVIDQDLLEVDLNQARRGEQMNSVVAPISRAKSEF